MGLRYLVIPNQRNGLVACCALALVRTLMWNTIYSKQPRLSRNTVGCYNAGSVLSNTACAISKQLFLQQPASLHSTDLYTENIYKNMTFNFESLFVALWGLHQARIGQRNGMIFCTRGICVWITGPVPVEFLLGHRSVWLFFCLAVASDSNQIDANRKPFEVRQLLTAGSGAQGYC